MDSEHKKKKKIQVVDVIFRTFSSVFFVYPSKSDLITGGDTEDARVRVDIMENQAMDFRNGFVRMCYTDVVSTTVY